MFLSHRARVVRAQDKGGPAEDVLRIDHPKNYIKVSGDAKQTFSSKAADEGIAFVKMASDQWKGPARPAFRWKRDVSVNNTGPRVSDRATGVIASVVDVVDAIKDSRRQAVFGRKVLTFHMRATYLEMASKLRKTLAPLLPEAPEPADSWVNTPWAEEWPFALSRKGCKVKPGHEKNRRRDGAKTLGVSSAVGTSSWSSVASRS